MRSVKKWLAVLLAALVIMPGSPGSMERMLVTEAAEEIGGTGAETIEAETLNPVDGLTDEGGVRGSTCCRKR